jgi:hypothetical protein
MVPAMMPMNGMRRRSTGSVFFLNGDLNGDALRTMFDSKHALDPAGHATDDGTRNAAEHWAGDLRTPVEAVHHATRHAIFCKCTDRRCHRSGSSDAAEKNSIPHRERFLIL